LDSEKRNEQIENHLNQAFKIFNLFDEKVFTV